MIADCTAVILAGGRSRRMGADKATLRLHQTTLLHEVVGRVAPLFSGVLVSVAAPRADLPWPQVCDERAEGGPLAGLCAALARVETSWIFALATDMPFVDPRLIELLAARRAGSDAVAARIDGQAQPLAAFYARRCHAPFAALLEHGTSAGGRSLRAALGCVACRYVEGDELRAADPELRSFFDLDTPQDLAAARRLPR